MGKKYIPTTEILDKIKDIANDGGTLSQIAVIINKDRSCVKRLLKDYNITLKPSTLNRKGRKYDWGSQKLKELRDMYDSDEVSLDDIANYFETSKTTILKKVRELDLKKTVLNIKKQKPRTGRHKTKVSIYSEEDDIFLMKNAKNMSIVELANKLNKPAWSVGKHMKQIGIKDRKKRSKIIPPNSKEFNDDIKNPSLSHSFLSRKYNVGVSTIKKWRINMFGTFKQMTDTYLCKSTAEIDFEQILSELNLAFIYEQKIDKWKVDYDLGFNCLVEIQGSYWHKKIEKVINKDIRKKDYLTQKGYIVIEIWDYSLQNKDFVKNKVLSILKQCIDNYYNGLITS